MHSVPIVLTVAGSDSSGGAGLQADIKAITLTGAYAAAVPTVLTAQNTQGVFAISEVSTQFVRQQLEVVCNDLNVSAMKVGMLYSTDIVLAVADVIKAFEFNHVVVDPVMIAKGGESLLGREALIAMDECLLPLASLITPNSEEARVLWQREIKSYDEVAMAAQALGERYETSVLVKGGHLEGEDAIDTLYHYDKRDFVTFSKPRVTSENTHGTGCTYASAIASFLAHGLGMDEAVRRAKNFVHDAIVQAADCKVGCGHGPLVHLSPSSLVG